MREREGGEERDEGFHRERLITYYSDSKRRIGRRVAMQQIRVEQANIHSRAKYMQAGEG